AETDEKAQQALAQYPREAVLPLKAGVSATLLELDQRTVAGEGRRPAHVNRVLPINFCGGPDEILAQLKQCREQIGAGVVDLSFQTPGFGTSRRADGSARTVWQEGAAAHPRHLKLPDTADNPGHGRTPPKSLTG